MNDLKITQSPLTWPAGWPRTHTPHMSRFGGGYNKAVSIAKAIAFIQDQLRLMDVRTYETLISTNLRLKQDGYPYSNQREPDDPGASVWWRKLGAEQYKVIALDRYNKVGDNLYAIGKTIEAMRGIERWGGSPIMDRAFTGFAALPAPEVASHQWWEVLGVARDAPASTVVHSYRQLRSRYHPDNQRHGCSFKFQEVQNAYQTWEKLTQRGEFSTHA